MGTLFHDALLAQHKDAVVVLDGGQTVGDGQGGAAMSQLFKALSHKDLALVIQCAGGFVQNQDGRVLQKYPGNGDTLLLDAKNCVVYGGKKLIAAVGVENLVIVEGRDSILVCPVDQAQRVKEVVETLEKEGRTERL